MIIRFPIEPLDSKEPAKGHKDRFLRKLRGRFHHLISIVPYLIRVFIVTVIIFTASIIVWNNYIRKDRHEVTLKQKVTNIINKLK